MRGWVGSLLVPVVLVHALSVSPRVLSTVNVVIVAIWNENAQVSPRNCICTLSRKFPVMLIWPRKVKTS